MTKRDDSFYKKTIPLKELSTKQINDLKSNKKEAIDETKNMILMSADEFVKGGKNIRGVPVCITPDGTEPKLVDDVEIAEPIVTKKL